MKQYKGYLEKYSALYRLDWLALAAQAYQESRFDHSLKSPAGAIGIMQLLPQTAAGSPIFISDIRSPENNIRAGAKYMAYLQESCFNDVDLPPEIRWDFTLAAYNMDPGRFAQLRTKARSMGMDPNKWFDNMEFVALKHVGMEPVRYVGNINKYYIAYRMAIDNLQREQEGIDHMRQAITNKP
ncbi:MAG TPA: hypothetical protein DCZ95_18805 [Verrucomicrobia bacterium]|nr:MAG: hypothetical protein A2X46_17045 [Lentisphaerae bacterium GWF2_57_35]HBA86137.1 hypothetical protein [Verrucomicrobiota bacterium]